MKYQLLILTILYLSIQLAFSQDCDTNCLNQRCWDYQEGFTKTILKHECLPSSLQDGKTIWKMKYQFQDSFVFDPICQQIKYNFKVITEDKPDGELVPFNNLFVDAENTFFYTLLTFSDLQQYCNFSEQNDIHKYECRVIVQFYSNHLEIDILQHTYEHLSKLEFTSKTEAFIGVSVVPSYLFDGCCDLNNDGLINLVMKQCQQPDTPPLTDDQTCIFVHNENVEEEDRKIVRGSIPMFRLELENEEILEFYQLELQAVRVTFTQGEGGSIEPSYEQYGVMRRGKKIYFQFVMTTDFEEQRGMKVEATVKLVRLSEEGDERRVLSEYSLRNLQSLQTQIEASDKLVKSNSLNYEIVDQEGNPVDIGGNNNQNNNNNQLTNTKNDEDDGKKETTLYSVIIALSIVLFFTILFAIYLQITKNKVNRANNYKETKSNIQA